MEYRWNVDRQHAPVTIQYITDQLARDMEALWEDAHTQSLSELFPPQERAQYHARNRFTRPYRLHTSV